MPIQGFQSFVPQQMNFQKEIPENFQNQNQSRREDQESQFLFQQPENNSNFLRENEISKNFNPYQEMQEDEIIFQQNPFENDFQFNFEDPFDKYIDFLDHN